MKAILEPAIALRRALEAELGKSRELSIALTKLDECAMWAGVAWTSQREGRPATLEQFIARVDELRG